MPLKICNFESLAGIRKEFEGNVGLYDPATDTIYIDYRLAAPIRGKREIILHEEGHRRIHKGGVNKYFTEDQEEAFCDLWAIIQYPKTKLRGFEKNVQIKVTGGLKWKDKKSKEKIIKNMLKEIGVRQTLSLVLALI